MKNRPSEASRVNVQVVLRDRMSISPDCSAAKRCDALSGTHLILPASLRTVAAIALHTSTSRPAQLPWLSAAENPARLGLTPHTIWPRCLMASSVLPACAAPMKLRASAAATACLIMNRSPDSWRIPGLSRPRVTRHTEQIPMHGSCLSDDAFPGAALRQTPVVVAVVVPRQRGVSDATAATARPSRRPAPLDHHCQTAAANRCTTPC